MFVNPDVATYGVHPVHAIVIASTFCLCATVMVLLRVYARLYLTKAFGLDDWLLLAAFATYVGTCGVRITISCIQAYRGITESIPLLDKIEPAFYGTYIVTSILLKSALGTFFLRIVQERWQRVTLIVSISMYTLFSSAFFFFFIGLSQCRLRSEVINTPNLHACVLPDDALEALHHTHSALNAVTDWIFVLTPIPLIIKTKMPIRTRVSVCFIILIGALGSIVSMVRFAFIVDPVKVGKNFFRVDMTLQNLSIVETGVGIICLSAAALRPFIREVVGVAKKAVGGSSCDQTTEESSRRPDVRRASIGRMEKGETEYDLQALNSSQSCARRNTFVDVDFDDALRMDSAGKDKMEEGRTGLVPDKDPSNDSSTHIIH